MKTFEEMRARLLQQQTAHEQACKILRETYRAEWVEELANKMEHAHAGSEAVDRVEVHSNSLEASRLIQLEGVCAQAAELVKQHFMSLGFQDVWVEDCSRPGWPTFSVTVSWSR